MQPLQIPREKEESMRKGRHRRHQQARELKQQTAAFSAYEAADTCPECRRQPHAEWCMAEDRTGANLD